MVALADGLGSGRVVDCGAGEGREALFLARRGFRVEAIDARAEPMAALAAEAAAEGLELTTTVADLRDHPLTGPFDGVIFMRVLHRMSRPEGRAVLARLRAGTLPGGVHVVAALTARGDLFQASDLEQRFVDDGELERIYGDWDILDLVRRVGRLAIPGSDGAPRYNEETVILARRSRDKG